MRPRTGPRTGILAAVLVPAALVLAGPVLTGCGADVGSSGGDGYVSGDGVITQLDPGDRKKPGDVTGETLAGDRVALSDYAGKVVVINVWGSWCAECRVETKVLNAAAEQLQPEGVVFLGINTRDTSPENARAYQDSREVPYPSIYDPGGKNLLAFTGTLTPNAIPSTVIIDPQGRVAASVLGVVPSARTLVDMVQDARG